MNDEIFTDIETNLLDLLTEESVEESNILDNHLESICINNETFKLPDNYLVDTLTNIIFDLKIENYGNILFNNLTSLNIYNLFVLLFCNINIGFKDNLLDTQLTKLIMNNYNSKNDEDSYFISICIDDFEEINPVNGNKNKYIKQLDFYRENKGAIHSSYDYVKYKFLNYSSLFKNEFTLNVWINFVCYINEI